MLDQEYYYVQMQLLGHFNANSFIKVVIMENADQPESGKKRTSHPVK